MRSDRAKLRGPGDFRVVQFLVLLVATGLFPGPLRASNPSRTARLLPPSVLSPVEHTAFSFPPQDAGAPPVSVQGLPVYPELVPPAGPAVCPSPVPPAGTPPPGPFDFRTRSGGRWSGFPGTLLWEPPLAIKREPRMQGLLSSLDNAWTEETVDTSIGLTAGLLRYEPADRGYAVQLDGFAVVMSRFSEWNYEVVADYRAGLPVTFACGPWQGKFGYEHTSSHLGDDTITRTGRQPILYVRDELVAGVGRRMWDDRIRAYGQAAWKFHGTVEGGGSPWRFDAGLEAYWRNATRCWGAPFAAMNLGLDGEVDYDAAWTVQVGWAWRDPTRRLSNARVFGEFYSGRSPYGQFYQTREQFYGFGLSLDY